MTRMEELIFAVFDRISAIITCQPKEVIGAKTTAVVEAAEAIAREQLATQARGDNGEPATLTVVPTPEA